MTDRGPWICTITGEPFHFNDIDPDTITPLVIGHALGNLCRFNGHVQEFYSVAQHCVLVSRVVPSDLALEGLMHDAAEAFVGDMVRPLKDVVGAAYRNVEFRVEAAIAVKFGLTWPWPSEVKEADIRLFNTETRDLTPQSYRFHPTLDYDQLHPLPHHIIPWGPHVATREWIKRFLELERR